MVPEPEASLTEAYEKWREWADGKSCCDYALHVDITHWSDSIKQEVQNLIKDKGEPLCFPPPFSLLSAWNLEHECQVQGSCCVPGTLCYVCILLPTGPHKGDSSPYFADGEPEARNKELRLTDLVSSSGTQSLCPSPPRDTARFTEEETEARRGQHLVEGHTATK